MEDTVKSQMPAAATESITCNDEQPNRPTRQARHLISQTKHYRPRNSAKSKSTLLPLPCEPSYYWLSFFLVRVPTKMYVEARSAHR